MYSAVSVQLYSTVVVQLYSTVAVQLYSMYRCVPVVERHQDELPVQQDLWSVQHRLAGTHYEGPAMEVDNNREEGAATCWLLGVDVEVEAVLATLQQR